MPLIIPTENNPAALVRGDCREVLAALPDASVDLLFADPPYFLSNGGYTVQGGKRAAVHKGDWDESRGLIDDYQFQLSWLREAQRVLKPSGSIWVSGTQHVIFSLGFAMQALGFHLLNTVTWFKPNASPNLACKTLTHSTELVIWARPRDARPMQHTFNYDDMRTENDGVQLRDMWIFPVTPKSEKAHGKHPTQKPLALLNRIVRCASRPGDLVVDPFNGSGTTGVAALACGRRYLGIELSAEYLQLSAARLGEVLARGKAA